MKNQKIISSLALFMILIMNMAFIKITYADTCVDVDGDGYIQLGTGIGDVDSDGNYSEEEWEVYFEQYKKEGGGCDGINFKKGAEPTRCDAVKVEDPSVVSEGSVLGKNVHPGAVDGPSNGIDEDCDGADGEYIESSGTFDLTEFLNNIINILGYYVVGGVSVLILLWGGVTYSSAAGDDEKTGKAVKAMKGAVIGLIVGIAAPSIITFIIDKVF